jgi:predicted kinase
MVGIPASGKSTFAKKYLNEDGVYLSRDEERFSMVKENENYFAKEPIVFGSWVGKIAWSLRAGFDVWADATHVNEKSRNKTFNELRKHGIDLNKIEVIAVFVDTPFQECVRRNEERQGRTKVPAAAMRDMVNRLKKPDVSEKYIDTVYIVRPNEPIYLEGKRITIERAEDNE